jgi:ABC-2 type transport system ATP-binding protein
VRRDILGTIIHTIAEQGRTVLFSSHLLEEVERVSDHVAMLHRGQVRFCARLDDIKETYHRLTLRFETDLASAPQLVGTLTCEGRGQEWAALCNGQLGELEAAVIRLRARIIERHTPSLNEVFMAQVRTNRLTN